MEEEARFTLAEHLEELRSRLWRIVLAIVVLGGVSLTYAREIFEVLMRPVLAALPEESRSLVYTSGIEEINVLLKVGLYAGLFLAVPVALYQLWKFIAPGLLHSERKMVGPFVSLGTVFFLGGALFCYFGVLPTMFQFLLTPGEAGAVRDRIAIARSKADDAARLLFVGEPARAAQLAHAAEEALASSGDGSVATQPVLSYSRVELRERLTRFGRLLDGTAARQLTPEQRGAAGEAIVLHEQAEDLLNHDKPHQAALRLEDAVAALTKALPGEADALGAVWAAQRHFAAATGALGEQEWTRPMLSMKEQLSLVLVLEIAFGLIFELPLLMALLAMLGLLKFRWVARSQRYAIVACVALAAIITPTGDIINLSLMAVPMIVCFELGLVLVWIFERRRARREAQQAADPGEGDDGTAAAAP